MSCRCHLDPSHGHPCQCPPPSIDLIIEFSDPVRIDPNFRAVIIKKIDNVDFNTMAIRVFNLAKMYPWAPVWLRRIMFQLGMGK